MLSTGQFIPRTSSVKYANDKYEETFNMYLPTLDEVNKYNSVSEFAARILLQSRHKLVSQSFRLYTNKWREEHPIAPLPSVNDEEQLRRTFWFINEPVLEYMNHPTKEVNRE